MQFMIDSELRKYFASDQNLFDQVMTLKGEVFRAVKSRKTQRIQLGNNYYFIKQHYGIGWFEILKDLLQLRLPIISAKNEWEGIRNLSSLNLPSQQVMGYGWRGINPATRQSFLITRELTHLISLEQLTESWRTTPPQFVHKRRILTEVARIARVLHQHGINHRDFYICHFLLNFIEYQQGIIKLTLIDLHRAQIRSKVPTRWIIKDLAGLYFSSKDSGLTQKDLWCFMKNYRDQSLRSVLNKELSFWLKVKNRGDQLYRKCKKA